jgi:N-acetylglucosamine-6-phosphate deacetylase
MKKNLLALLIILLSTFKYGETAEMFTKYYNATVLRNHEFVREDLWVSAGKIIAPQSHCDLEIDVEGRLIAPGYIDVQINGAFGIDLTSNPEEVDHIARGLCRYGVTSFLPTIVSASADHYKQGIPLLKEKIGNTDAATILGIHLEGPFINPHYCGAHDSGVIPGTFEDMNSLIKYYSSLEGVAMVTLAPELPGAIDIIKELKAKNIIVSAGHSNANTSAIDKGLEAGVSMITHLFNAMRPFHHRDPGIIGAALTDSRLYYSLIVDGKHLDSATTKLAWKAHPEGLILVSDAMAATGLSEGIYQLGTGTVSVDEDGTPYINGTSILAGSTLTLNDAVRRLRKLTGCSAAYAIECASLKPALLLGKEKEKGSLDLGADADFIFLDDDLHVKATFIAGTQVYLAD